MSVSALPPPSESLIVQRSGFTCTAGPAATGGDAPVAANPGHQAGRHHTAKPGRRADQKLATLQDAAQQAKILAAELAGKELQVQARSNREPQRRNHLSTQSRCAISSWPWLRHTRSSNRSWKSSPRCGLIWTRANGRGKVLRSRQRRDCHAANCTFPIRRSAAGLSQMWNDLHLYVPWCRVTLKTSVVIANFQILRHVEKNLLAPTFPFF